MTNICTETEAKKKWCPLVRIVEHFPNEKSLTSVRNRVAIIERDNASFLAERLVGCQCIASSCMMWRWVREKDLTRGYCGLAGRGDIV